MRPRPERRGAIPAIMQRILLVAVLAAGVALPARAQQELNIRAVVNDEAISAYDVEQRLNLIIRTSSLPDTPRVRRDIMPRVVDSLVEEALQLQEAKRLNVVVTPAEIESALALIERQNKLPPGGMEGYLKQQGVDMRTVTRQIEASLSWSGIVRRQLLRTVSVTEEDVNKALKRIKENAGKPRVLVAEIFIAVDSPREEANAKRGAQQIFDELRRGANFAQIARQFSQAASAERGGDLGWVVAGELDPELDKVLASLPKGATSTPIRTSTGFYILMVRDRREPATPSVGDTVVALRQVLLPLPANARTPAVESQKGLAETIRGSVRGCADFSNVTRELGTGMSGDLGKLKLGELPENLRKVVAGLDVGVPSAPVVASDSVRVLMVCDRQVPADAGAPKREEIERRLTVQRLELRARRYLRDLRDAAFLDIRA
jgi:peptidyl-prolyl cis-trans isomerase SurA